MITSEAYTAYLFAIFTWLWFPNISPLLVTLSIVVWGMAAPILVKRRS